MPFPSGTPRSVAQGTSTPRNSGGRVTKSGGSGTCRGPKAKTIAENLTTPTKSGRTVGETVLDAIRVESDGEVNNYDMDMVLKEDVDTETKVENEEKAVIKEEVDEAMTGVEATDANNNTNTNADANDTGSDTEGIYAWG